MISDQRWGHTWWRRRSKWRWRRQSWKRKQYFAQNVTLWTLLKSFSQFSKGIKNCQKKCSLLYACSQLLKSKFDNTKIVEESPHTKIDCPIEMYPRLLQLFNLNWKGGFYLFPFQLCPLLYWGFPTPLQNICDVIVKSQLLGDCEKLKSEEFSLVNVLVLLPKSIAPSCWIIVFFELEKQDRKLGRCDSSLQNLKTLLTDWPNHMGRC